MAKKYQLHLKGFVGGWDFDRNYVDYVLEKNKDSEVNVIIDSLGGRVDSALSISSAFNRHGNVHVHFVGMNASAATIASMGAKHISIDSSAMYLVHKGSVSFFKWANLNSDQLQDLIEEIKKAQETLDKVDANVALMYARRCKKTPQDLLALMKKGGWLTSKEALEWGFVDEITEYEDDAAPVLDEVTVHALAEAGIPMPKGLEKEKKHFLDFIAQFAQFFGIKKEEKQESTEAEVEDDSQVQVNENTSNSNFNYMKKFVNLCALLVLEALTFSKEKTVELTEEQCNTIEDAIKADKTKIEELTNQVTNLENEKTTLTAQVEALKKKPAEDSKQVVGEKKEQEGETNAVKDYVDTVSAAQNLYDMFG